MKDRRKFRTPIQRFINAKSLGGIMLFGATILALIMANSPLSDFYHSIWNFEIGIQSESFKLVKPLILWINDGLMAIFFFLTGLEIKRELLIGELNTLKKASLPIFAALGGMIIPIIIYISLNNNPETANGWAMPMATDIAFSLAILKLLGKRVPLGLKIFLTAFAIIDDIGAVLVIAVFYTTNIQWILLLIAFVLLAILYFLSYKRIHNKYLIFFFGIIIWVLFLESGIHPTIAGILLAFSVPIRQRINEHVYARKLKSIVNNIVSTQNTNTLPVLSEKQIILIDNLEQWTNKVQSPLQQLENSLHNWVAFFIMPIFAFANAGIVFGGEQQLNYELASHVGISLLVGKLIGISLFSFLTIKLKFAELPKSVTFTHIIGVALLGGVGFTMSLFIGNLAFFDHAIYLNSSKLGIVIASLAAAALGYIVLRFASKK